jgi:hypothetical protein
MGFSYASSLTAQFNSAVIANVENDCIAFFFTPAGMVGMPHGPSEYLTIPLEGSAITIPSVAKSPEYTTSDKLTVSAPTA